MAVPDRLQGDRIIYGTSTFVGAVTLPSSTITNAMVSASAAIEASKLEHRFNAPFAQPNSAATAETKVFYVARASGTVLDIDVGSIAAAVGDSTVTVDVKKNGTTILSSVVTLDNANTAYVVEAATLSGTPTYVAGDVFTYVTTATVGTGTLPTGVFGFMCVKESAA